MEKTWIERTCREPNCGVVFSISPDEQQWLEERNLKPFTRCSDCRKKRREQVKLEQQRETAAFNSEMRGV